ncbi:type IV pilus modification PilV family protein [Limnobacter sp.]|uniref:type IV pilus modification PilV family protein n=1 Tax=Limnobacter sp. TaxID=2003368 RepID=UPI002FE01E64
MKLDSRKSGFSLIDALIAILVLSIGVVLYAKNWTANFGAKNSTHVRSIAATQVAEIGNVLLANISDLDRDTPRGQIVSRIQQFSGALVNHLNGFARARGYECANNGPQALNAPNNAIDLNGSTLPRVWAQGAASCVKITPLPSQSTQTNGMWVHIEVRWIDAHTRRNQTESVSVHTLVSPL